MNNKNFFVLLPLLALVVLAVGVRPAFAQVSVGGTVNVGGGTTTATTTTPPTPSPTVIRHDHFRDFGHHGFLGLGLGVNPALAVNAGVGGLITATTAPGFTTFRDFAHLHNEHFVLLNNRFVLLPSTVACPAGTQLIPTTGECAILQGQQTVVEQQAPTILQEQVQAPTTVESEAVVPQSSETVIQQQAAPATQVQSTETETTTTAQTVAPTVTCPAGSSLDNGQCTIVTQSTQTVQPNVSCQAGFTLQGGQCIEQQQQITVDPLPCPSCPAGSSLNGGQCVVSALPSAVTTVGSTPNEIIISGHHFLGHFGDLPFLHFRH